MLTQTKEQAAPARAQLLGSMKGATGPLIGLVLLCLFLTLWTDTFFSVRNFLNILDQITVLGIMAVGMTLVILIGGIDLAVGSVMALTMMVLGYLNVELGVPMGIAIAVALGAAALNGLVAGLLITRFNVPAFIATLAMMSITRGLANMITNGQQIIGFPSWFNMAAIVRYGGFLTMTVALMLVVFLLGILYQRYRYGGRALYAIGGNPEVARLAGINVKFMTVMVYIVCSVLAGLSGIVLGARLDSVQPSSGVGYELDAIAAVVIGGTSLSGGTGGIGGTVVGVLIIGVLRNGLNLLSVSPFMQQVVIGAVIVLAVTAETFRKRK
ncbi:monosaccharide-transporting ATPase [Gemmobacter aquaticus]|uniref:Monosaccharide-transporting ATPase n=1 Tax=Gemmobacter aquaticus TaxID=490185 RepID=A0A918DFF5_9RHOB|nr:ABC transporter permease [Gemmobacter aquaticus]GGO38799.1 monosaccharide-transporting ATPase [Gemmobacter aquaticus]